MPRRNILTESQRKALLDLPTDKISLLHYYTLAEDDLEIIRDRRRPHNKFGFALQLCALRYPGRLLALGEGASQELTSFLAVQLGLKSADLVGYATREETRREHIGILRDLYGYEMFSGQSAKDLKAWLRDEAKLARSNEDLARRFVDECRRTMTVLPGISVIERLCADALVEAERQTEGLIANRLDPMTQDKLNAMLSEEISARASRFIWLRQFEVGENSADMGRLLDRLEFLQEINLERTVLDQIPPRRVMRLRKQGERYFSGDLRDVPEERRLAILAVCVVEWRAAIADTIVETHDRIVGKTWREAKAKCDALAESNRLALHDTLRAFSGLGSVLINARDKDILLDDAIGTAGGWNVLEDLMSSVDKLTDTRLTDPVPHVVHGYCRFRRYVSRMLRTLDIRAAPVAEPLLTAAQNIAAGNEADPSVRSISFLSRGSKWRRYLTDYSKDERQLWEVCVLFHLRDAFRSGDMWLAHSRRYGDLKDSLVPAEVVQTTPDLFAPLSPEVWLHDRKERMEANLKRLAHASREGLLPGKSIEESVLKDDTPTHQAPAGVDEFVLDLYQRLPEVRVTDLLLEVDKDINFTEAFTHLRTGAVCTDKIGLLNVLLAEGLNLGLSKMAEASNTHDYWQLSRLARWYVEGEAVVRALHRVIESQSKLPMAQFWGSGLTASSDGQFFPTTRHGEAMNLVNSRYGHTPGVKAYTHVSDQFGPFATQTIPSTVNEAPYILDGLLMNETGRKIQEQYADTGGFTDHVFAVTSLLGFQFIPRIRDLPSKKLYVFDLGSVPDEAKEMIGGKIREPVITTNWLGVLRSCATMASGVMSPSQLLRKFAAYPRQHELAFALREIGRVERTLFIINWLLDPSMRRRAQIGLNKGEAHHALKNALRIGRQGEIRDRTTESQHFRMAGLNLLAAIVIYWNTKHLSRVLKERECAGLSCAPEFLAHTSPLGWAHILLTGEYRWPKK